MASVTIPPRPLAVVADDNALIRMDAADILESAGFTPLEAGHADHALSLLEQHHAGVQVLFTDVQMPGSPCDGFALAREAAANWPHIAIVVASGELRPQPGDLPDGATFVSKPFSADVIHDHLCRLLPPDTRPSPLRNRDR